MTKSVPGQSLVTAGRGWTGGLCEVLPGISMTRTAFIGSSKMPCSHDQEHGLSSDNNGRGICAAGIWIELTLVPYADEERALPACLPVSDWRFEYCRYEQE